MIQGAPDAESGLTGNPAIAVGMGFGAAGSAAAGGGVGSAIGGSIGGAFGGWVGGLPGGGLGGMAVGAWVGGVAGHALGLPGNLTRTKEASLLRAHERKYSRLYRAQKMGRELL